MRSTGRSTFKISMITSKGSRDRLEVAMVAWAAWCWAWFLAAMGIEDGC